MKYSNVFKCPIFLLPSEGALRSSPDPILTLLDLFGAYQHREVLERLVHPPKRGVDGNLSAKLAASCCADSPRSLGAFRALAVSIDAAA